MEKFTFKINLNSPVSYEPNIKSVKFGNGYEQVIQDGINHNLRKYQGLTIAVNKDKGREILAFLNRHGGYKKFQWEGPTGETIFVRCKTWTHTPHWAVDEFSLNFEEVL